MKTYDLYYVDENGKKHYFDGISDMEVISSEKASLLRDKILGTNNKDGDENIFNLKGNFEISLTLEPYRLNSEWLSGFNKNNDISFKNIHKRIPSDIAHKLFYTYIMSFIHNPIDRRLTEYFYLRALEEWLEEKKGLTERQAKIEVVYLIHKYSWI